MLAAIGAVWADTSREPTDPVLNITRRRLLEGQAAPGSALWSRLELDPNRRAWLQKLGLVVR
jgi:hypothetical protein